MESGNNVDPTAGVASPEKSTIDIIQQRFKADEHVHLIFEAYQIRGQEHSEGLLTLVSSESGGTYAIISFSLLRTPLTASNELKINNVFAINGSFKLTTETTGIVTNQFNLSTDNDRPSKYYYHPIRTEMESVDFNEFYAKINSYKSSMWNADMPSETTLNFRWLDDYREIGEVKQELKKRESQYIVYKDFTVYCATWNVNNQPCWDSSISLRPWLARSDKAPDIYVIGLQEMETTKKAILNATQMEMIQAQWIRKMLENVHEGVEYEELRSVRLAGILLTVIVRKQLRPHIHCRVCWVARGVFKTLGNKGGVAASLQLNEANICFINSHLAAHMGNVMIRNEDYKAIEEGTRFDGFGPHPITISDHDHIFWLGDLNYRIQEPPGLQCDAESYELRLQYDQLRKEMSQGRCFKGYTEGEIKFLPTYKYDVGTDTYDTSEKQRAPAYCDRVLWKGKRIEQLLYNSVMEIRESDHKPVFAIFRVKIKTRDEAKYKRIQEEVLKAVDKRENDNQPQITAERTVIEFGLVRFNEPSVRDFNVYNNCPQQVDFEFKVKDSPLNDICEKWLNVDPRSDSLMIDSARSIRLRMMIDPSSITGLLKKICNTSGKCDFDILILHVRSGRDIFITVTGEYQPSCFGLSMETMCRTDRPISEYKQDQVKQMMLDVSPEYRVTMPREFFLLIDYLHKHGDELKGIFQSYDRRRQLSSHFNAVRDWLDTWSEDEFPGTPQTAAEALLLFLDLPEEALLEPLVEDLLVSRSKSEAMELIHMLSAPKRNVFMHLCMFLREVIERYDYELSSVAAVFGRILLRSSKRSLTIDYQNSCSDFMRRFIESEDTAAGGNGYGGVTGASLQT
ncbi:type II inositol 1,4,5-trisphosphate 5-phosphatase [Drosophila grimshawi]|uniref:type II inositol 1,4,5-trisphosphate 5-phosphatase n=1 Tax=Drosophila grimshawi TaxID=7222 RepID=UPI000C86ED06|nr:type II inositol 1,4,5-trisphosphate 5-phosphatase [Drosophila grimshawi]XP_032594113.1 type II inositol 1,4,5-trisphosphate 5-phosphatase [Drosophila grimshawi]XP_032594114.1 type II inositol 1,4,5-trisphosphate 5-phosphatase [Drosophila grimshawi]